MLKQFWEKLVRGKILTFWRQLQNEGFHVRAKRRRLDSQLQNAYRNKNLLPVARRRRRRKIAWCLSSLSIRRRRKARPGTITEEVKFNRPIRDCNSRKLTLRRLHKDSSNRSHFWSLSSDKRASWLIELSVIPANCMTWNGPQVFS